MKLLKKIKTRKDYEEALARFEEVFHAKPGTKESDEADVLAILIEEFERRSFLIESPDPIEAIRYRMEQEGLSNKDLAEILGFKSRVSDLFNHRRKLTLTMIKSLHEKLHIPLEALIK